MKKFVWFSVLLLFVGMSVSAQRPWQNGSKVSVYQTAPNFKVKMSNGKTLELKKLKGKVVFLDFGGITCGPCIKAQKTFQEQLFDKYSPKDLVVIPVLSGSCKGWDEIAAFQKKHGFNFPFGWDKEYSIGYMPRGGGVPQWFVINRFGVITALGSDEKFVAAVDAAIQQTEKMKTRKLQGRIFMITPEVGGKKVITINGYITDAVIEAENPKATELLQALETADANNHQVELEVEEGTLKVLGVKELDLLARAKVAPKKVEKEVIDYSQGVTFQNLTLEQAFAKAKLEKKRVFLDCSTTWCGPCKKMDKYVFPLKAVGELFNQNFISLKYNIGEGEGKTVKAKYDISLVPTYLFLNPDGSVYHYMVGAYPEKELLELITGILADEKKTITYQEALFTKGQLPRSMYRDYIFNVAKVGDGKKVETIMADLRGKITPSEKMHPDNWAILESAAYGSTDYQFIVENEAALRKSVGDERVDFYLYQTFFSQLSGYIYPLITTEWLQSAAVKSNYEKIMKEMNAKTFKDKEQLLEIADMVGAAMSGDAQRISTVSRKLIDTWHGRSVEAVLFLTSTVGSIADMEYVLSLKDKIMTHTYDALATGYWNERFRVIVSKINYLKGKK